LGEEPALVSNKGLLAAALMAVHQVLGTARCRSLISSSPRSNCRAQIGADFLGRAMVEKHLIDHGVVLLVGQLRRSRVSLGKERQTQRSSGGDKRNKSPARPASRRASAFLGALRSRGLMTACERAPDRAYVNISLPRL